MRTSSSVRGAERSEWARASYVLGLYGLLLAVSAAFVILDPKTVAWRYVALAIGAGHATVTLGFLARDPIALRPVLPGGVTARRCLEALVCAAAAIAVFWLFRAAESALGLPSGDPAGGGPKLYATYGEIFLLAVLPAIVEEIAFRGLMFSALEPWLGGWQTVLVTASLFSLLHLSPVKIPLFLGLGLVLGWLRVRSRSLVPPLLMHFVYNSCLVLLASR